jgi:hypothetical protein
MKSTELQILWKLVKSREDRPLAATDMALLLRIRFALQESMQSAGSRICQIGHEEGCRVTAESALKHRRQTVQFSDCLLGIHSFLS